MKFSWVLCLMLFSNAVYTQSTEFFAENDEEERIALIELTFGNQFDISNINIECGEDAFGFYEGCNDFYNSTFGLCISSGKVTEMEGPNDGNSSSNIIENVTSDTDLADLSNVSINDICRFSFDFTSTLNTFSFRYIFGSEEYYTYVCTIFNDSYGIWLTNMETNEKELISLIPNTEIFASINSINNGKNSPGGICSYAGITCPCNSEYFIDNLFPPGDELHYGGYTIPFIIEHSIEPGTEYNLKFAICDGGDTALDSGIQIDGSNLGNLFSNFSELNIYSSNDEQTDKLTEGCSYASLEIKTSSISPIAFEPNLQFLGSAELGIDFILNPEFPTIEAGQSSTTFEIIPINDNITEGQESIVIYLVLPCSESELELPLYDLNFIPGNNQSFTICKNEELSLLAGNADQYLWEPANNLSCNDCPNPNFIGTESEIITLKLFSEEYDCELNRIFEITVEDCVGIEPSHGKELIVFYNANVNSLEIKNWDPAWGKQIIVDFSGRIKSNQNLNSNSLACDNFPIGMYFLLSEHNGFPPVKWVKTN